MKLDISKFHPIENYFQLFIARIYIQGNVSPNGGLLFMCVCFFSVLFFFVSFRFFRFSVQVDNNSHVICMPMTESQPLSWYDKLKDLVFHMQVF